jgi:hypothetical protein
MVRDGAEVKSGADGVIGIDSQFAESLEFQDSIHEFRGDARLEFASFV